ncbi:type III PLP-dependent enzyme domain-containing protein [Brevibacillus migulae]|uniref:diaminopimelate decarboxylase n=1 Tax=Brevibacillus migulae TaxID=1644114 RepID=UPI00106EAAB9|nr:diaminopimelate decarboxylase [Brevibacillus migulae]
MYTYDQLSRWYELYQSAFYLFDADRLLGNYSRMRQAFAQRYPDVRIGYSYKTNYLPYLCYSLHEAGAYAEVVSGLEYELACKLGVAPQHIIFNGPLKREAELQEALQKGCIVNLDSWAELEMVINCARENPLRQINVGLRVNFQLDQDGKSPLQSGYEVSRFGFCVENGSYHMALQRLEGVANVSVVGLHGHFSANRSLSVYETITRTLCQLAVETLGDNLSYIDVGGGMYGPLPDTFQATDIPSYEDYAEVICSAMHEELRKLEKKPTLILEPGISLVADTFIFVCKVIDRKENRGKRFVLVDGSVHNIKPTMHPHNLPMQIISPDPRNGEAEYHVVGYTCMEKDYLLFGHKAPEPQIGDFLLFSHVGAYTIVFSPPFIKERPPIIATRKDEWLIARRKETIEAFFSDELYHFPSQPSGQEENAR